MKFIDANVIAYAFYDNPSRERCQEIIKDGGLINTINLVESYNIIEAETTREYAAKAIISLLKSNLRIIQVDTNLIFETLKRSLRYKKLKFIDLLHYVTALLNNCSEIASYDKDFDNLDIKRIT